MPTPRGAPGRLPGCSLRHRSPESGSWAALQSGGPKAPHGVTCSPSSTHGVTCRLLHTRLARAGSPATVPRSRAGPKRGGKGRGAQTSKVLRVKTLAVGAEGDLNRPRWPF